MRMFLCQFHLLLLANRAHHHHVSRSESLVTAKSAAALTGGLANFSGRRLIRRLTGLGIRSPHRRRWNAPGVTWRLHVPVNTTLSKFIGTRKERT